MTSNTYKQHNTMPRPTFGQSSGFTLVEVMIAIALGIFLTGGLIQVYASSKHSSEIQYQLSEIQSAQRVSFDFLNRDIRMAGFVDKRKKMSVHPVVKLLANGTANSAVTDADSDEITVRYEATTDCLGNATTLAGPNSEEIAGVTTPITITQNRYFVDRGTQTLFCQGLNKAVPDPPQPIADNVVDMQVMYGIDSLPAAGDGVADTFVNAAGLTRVNINGGPVISSQIISVRIALLFRSASGVKTAPEAASYYLLDEAPLVFNNRHRYEVINTTIALRN